jgi:hypothetical protein
MNEQDMPFVDKFMIYARYGIAGGLAKASVEATKVMKDALRKARPYPAVYSGELVDSITYGMKPIPAAPGFSASDSAPGNPDRRPLGPHHKQEHVIKPVTAEFESHVGTADPKGKYINKGTLPHKTNRDSAQFVANMKEWGASKKFTDSEIMDLINNIRRFGTAARPFLPPAKEYADSVIKAYVDASVRKALKNMPKVIKVIDKNGVSFGARFSTS